MARGRRAVGEPAMTETQTVLVVDDDEAIVAMMRDFLEAEGYQVEAALDAQQAQECMERTRVDCLLLDIMMPGQSGFELCREVRRTADTPILFLSARGEDADKVRGFGLGADDYIVKSASPIEVVARVRAVLRRSVAASRRRAVLRVGRLELDLAAHEARIDGELVSLSPREFEILCFLAQHPREVFTYEQLIERFWDGVGDRHTVTVLMGRLREKVEADPANPRTIVNVWGIGYRFEE
jgi:two-component system, OmpR family, response regulator